MTNTMPDLGILRAKVAEMAIKIGEHDRHAEERTAQRQQRRRERRQAAQDAAAHALLTGVPPTIEPDEPQADEKLIRAKLVEQHEQAKLALRNAVIAAGPSTIAEVDAAATAVLSAYERLGEAVLEPYGEIVAGEAQVTEAVRALDALVDHLGGDPTRPGMQSEVRRRLGGLCASPSESAVVGWVVARTLAWLRAGSSPAPGVAARFGPLPGSCVYGGPAVGDPLGLPTQLPILPRI